MAQVNSVEILNSPNFIEVGELETVIEVAISIAFHPLDLKLEMEYVIDVIIFDIHGPVDIPVVVANWEDTKVLPVAVGSKDRILGLKKTKLVSKHETEDLKLNIKLRLGSINDDESRISRNLNAFATLTPAIGRSSKWSVQFESILLH